jgi:hypothetical protein
MLKGVTPSYQPLRLSDDSPVTDYVPREYIATGKSVAASNAGTRSVATDEPVARMLETVSLVGNQPAGVVEDYDTELLSRLIRQAAALRGEQKEAGTTGLTMPQKIVIHCAIEACELMRAELSRFLAGSPSTTTSSSHATPELRRRSRKTAKSDKDHR